MSADGRLGAIFVRSRAEADFRALYRAVTPSAYGLALRLSGGDENEAMEVVQDAWVRAVMRLDRYRAGEPFGAWLRGIVVNCWRERTRSRRRAAEVLLNEHEVPAVEQDAAGDLDVDRDALRQAVHALPDGYRDVLILHDVEGYTHAEIARMLEVTEGTSKSQLSRARARLRRALASDVSRALEAQPTREGPHVI